MRNKIIFALVVIGALGALFSAYVYAVPSRPLPPVFNPAPNPYAQGIYANGIVESDQSNGENMNLYPEVAGAIVRIFVSEGQSVTQGTPLVQIDDSVQRATTEQQRSQAEAAQALLAELRAQPRRENLEVAQAQVELAAANLKTAEDTLAKQRGSYELAPESVSKDALDNAVNAQKVAKANLEMVTRQYDLTRAGAWVFDVRNQEKQAEALEKAAAASSALLAKYTIKAPADGVVMTINATAGSYASPQGSYDTYTQGADPLVVMSSFTGGTLDVRCYIDEILIPRLPPAEKLRAQMFIRGTSTKIPLEFVRVQPYVSPKIQLSNQRQEKVDLRVLPVIFRFQRPPGVQIFPGELVYVYVGESYVRRALIALLVTGAVSIGCAVGPDFHRPAAPADRGYTSEPPPPTAAADGKAQRFSEAVPVGASWWTMLGCPALDSLVGHALAGNPGLESARATLRRNQDGLRAGYGVFFPQLDAHAGASRQLYNPAPGTIPSNTFNLFTASASVSYTIDVWGGERRQVEVLGAAVDAQRYALAGAYVMLTSNVVDAAIALTAYQAQIDATKATLVVLREQVRIANAQAMGGTVPYSNVLSLRSQVASVEAMLPALQERVDQASDLLAALVGTTPGGWKPPSMALADFRLPQDLPLSLPSQLVRQRADVLIAEAELHAASANIGVATAAMLPNVTLSAGYGLGATAGGVGPVWNLAAGAIAPLLHGGALYYQREAAIDARDAAAAEYKQTVLAAFEQVADTLRGLGHDADTLVAQTEAVETSEEALHLVQANYAAGIATYLQVLVADIQFLQAKIGYIEAVGARLQDTVALYAALGGGWWDAPAATHG